MISKAGGSAQYTCTACSRYPDSTPCTPPKTELVASSSQANRVRAQPSQELAHYILSKAGRGDLFGRHAIKRKGCKGSSRVRSLLSATGSDCTQGFRYLFIDTGPQRTNSNPSFTQTLARKCILFLETTILGASFSLPSRRRYLRLRY